MTGSRRPDDFDWVSARQACSVAHMFEVLARQARQNVDALHAPASVGARVLEEGTCLSVVTDRGTKARFRLTADHIEVEVFGLARAVQLRATVGMDDDGACRLCVDGQLLQPWQLLRRALEPLFFPTNA